jgi:hypothetical protein
MKEFIVMLMLTILAFSDTYRTINDGNTDDDKFVDGSFDSFLMVYKIAIGDFDAEFGTVALWMCTLFFYLATIFNLIVMFNLLIAIISETFTEVNENAEAAAFKERANTVAANAYLVPDTQKSLFCEDNQFLIAAVYKEETTQDKGDNVEKLISDLQN